MNTSYNKEGKKYEGIILESKPSTQDPPNPYQIIDSDYEMETT